MSFFTWDHCYCEPATAENYKQAASDLIAVPPSIFAPKVALEYDRRINASSNPQWVSGGRVSGLFFDAAGGAANPTEIKGGKPGYSLDGGDYIPCPSGMASSLASHTFVFWTKITGATGQAYLFDSSSPARFILFVRWPTDKAIIFSDNATLWICGTFPSDSLYHFLALEVTGPAGTFRAFLDSDWAGAAVPHTNAGTFSGTMKLGSRYDGAANFTIGELGSFYHFERVISKEELLYIRANTRHRFGV